MIKFRYPKKVTDYLYYRNRYWFAYTFIGLVILGILLVAWLNIPGGLRAEELSSAVTSGKLSVKDFEPSMVINMPYHALQRLSFIAFGVSKTSIALPSFIIAIMTAIGTLLLLKNWFRASIAIPTTLIAVTTPQFIFMAQDGMPAMAAFTGLSIWFLLAGTFVAWRRAPHLLWKVLFFIIAALLLYVPLGIYLVLALVSTVLFHPRARRLFHELSRPKLLIAGFLALVAIAPIAYAVFRDYTIGLTLLGLPSEVPNIKENIVLVMKQWFDFLGPSTGAILTPVYSLGVSLLMLVGIYRLFHVRYTAKSYITWTWMALLIPIMIVNPRLAPASFLVAVLLIARGINLLLDRWYGLFPRNPYARIAGLVPVSIFVLGILFSSVNRYVYSYYYSPDMVRHFSKDLRIIENYARKNSSPLPVLITSQSESAFYELAAKYNKHFTVSTDPKARASTTIVTRDARPATNLVEPSNILTGAGANNSDRFYIYKSSTK